MILQMLKLFITILMMQSAESSSVKDNIIDFKSGDDATSIVEEGE